MSMTIDQMIVALNAIKEKVGGGERIPIVLVGWGNTDYVEASHPIVGDFCDQNGETFKCAFVGGLEGTEFTRKGVSFLRWKWNEDMLDYDAEKAEGKNAEIE